MRGTLLALGVLFVSLSFPPQPYAAPDLIVTAVSNPPASATLGSRLSVTETVKNQGPDPADVSSKVGYWLKDMANGTLYKLTHHRVLPGLASDASSTGTTIITIPVSVPAGTYQFRACADVFGTVAESHEGNNCRFASAIISVTLPAVTVETVGPGLGTVTSDLAGIDCGEDCVEGFAYDTEVTLSAIPAAGSLFAGWISPWIRGCSPGDGPATCALTMDADKHVAAVFGPVLKIRTVGPGSGVVIPDASGIACATDCEEWYSAGTVVTVSAIPDPGSSFSGWSGSCVGPNPTCTVTMNSERAVTAFWGPGSLSGSLDLSFGQGGRVTTNFYHDPDGNPSFDLIYAMVLQPDGKIVVGGEVGAEIFGDLHDFALARYNADGSLDPDFGDEGIVMTDFKDYGFDLLYALVLQPDGKLVAGGRTTPVGGSSGGNFDFALARYNPDGSLDSSFGNGGKVTTDFEAQDDAIRALAVQPDGKLVAAGRATINDSNDFAVARYNPDGSLDSSFGVNGKITTTFGSGYERGLAMVLQPDGKIIVAGAVYVNDPNIISPDFGLARSNPDGSLDATFGVGGKVTTDFGGFDQIRALLLQPDGKILAAGPATPSGDLDFGLARYNSDGSLDSTFGNGGKVSTDFGSLERAYALLLQSDGHIVAGGVATVRAREVSALARYNPDGSLDPGFGNNGKAIADFGRNSQIRALLFHPGEGKIIAGGFSQGTNLTDFSLERYHP